MASMWVLIQIKDWFKYWTIALLFLLIVVVFWILIFIPMSPVLVPVFIASKFKEEANIFGKKVLFKQWSLNMFLSQDQAANTILGGSMDTNVSGRVGYHAIRENGIALKMEVAINLLFKILFKQENHCRASIENDEYYNVNWGG